MLNYKRLSVLNPPLHWSPSMDFNSFNEVRYQLDFTKRMGPWLRTLVFDALLVVAIVHCLLRHDPLGTVLATLLLPILFFNGFALMHEAVHRSLSPRRWVNDLIGVLGGAFCFLPFEPWRLMHIEHHQWAGNVDKDPVNKLRKDYDPRRKTKYRILSAIWRSWIPLLALMQHMVFWMYPLKQLRTLTLDRKGQLVYAASYFIPAGIYLGLPLLWPEVFNFWNFAPGIALYLMLVEFVNLPHHLDLPTYRGKARLAVKDQYLVARSAVYPQVFSRWALLNFNLHLEHHLFPTLPWHELEKARVLVKPILGAGYNETTGGVWLFRHRRRSIDELLAPRASENSEDQELKNVA